MTLNPRETWNIAFESGLWFRSLNHSLLLIGDDENSSLFNAKWAGRTKAHVCIDSAFTCFSVGYFLSSAVWVASPWRRSCQSSAFVRILGHALEDGLQIRSGRLSACCCCWHFCYCMTQTLSEVWWHNRAVDSGPEMNCDVRTWVLVKVLRGEIIQTKTFGVPQGSVVGLFLLGCSKSLRRGKRCKLLTWANKHGLSVNVKAPDFWN